MKTTINNVKITIDNVQYMFHDATYNGMEIIQESETKFVNASSFCKQFKKRLGRLFESVNWKEYISEFELEFKDELEGKSTMANLPPWSFKLNAGIPDSLKRLRGLYVHPKLINYIAIWCSPKYSIKVGKIMDSINDKVHERLKAENKEDTPTNAKPIFESTISTVSRFVSDDENKRCWGVREVDKFDYLDSYDKDFIKSQFNKFKQSLKTINFTIEELKRDYPSLLD